MNTSSAPKTNPKTTSKAKQATKQKDEQVKQTKQVKQTVKSRWPKKLTEKLKLDFVIITIIILLFGLFIFSLINLLTILQLSKEWSAVKFIASPVMTVMRYHEEPSNKITVPEVRDVQVEPLVTEIPREENRDRWRYNVFGDGFSNSYYVDMGKTNFHYDDMANAFYFTPLYKKIDQGACTQTFCGFAKEEESEFCLAKNKQPCVSWAGGKLKYNGSEVKEFTAFFTGQDKQLQKVSLYPLTNYWLIGAVWTEAGQELGQVWRFDGKNLTVLDFEKRVPFVTRPGYGGSNIYFGGDENNYIVLYLGYDISAYQVVNNTLWNITDFFNLRLADQGFVPQIIKQQQGKETFWYICSLTAGKPKLIKLWQNGSQVIRGSMSLGEDFFASEDESALCRLGAGGNLEIATAQKVDTETNYHQWTFIDQGFDQTHDYQAVSANLFSANGVIKMANFGGLSLCSADFCDIGALDDRLIFSISNNGNNWSVPVIGEEYLFTDSGSKLLWKLEASAEASKSYYSPWFSAINSVYYAWLE
ncbi:hypothetical protein GX917_01245 [Candidatus Falkowbacteria bacterium]|mgnify:CR=1 FL=1|jgi:hypothetical protein|nr:hypothetical protein [Candidatus Falkowbacteria bacterium]